MFWHRRLAAAMCCLLSAVTVSTLAQNTVIGCKEYNKNGGCGECFFPAYVLASGDKCACGPGYQLNDQQQCKPGPCFNRCGQTYIRSANSGYCHCDYFCNNHDDCCGGSASKDALCLDQAPTINKALITSCNRCQAPPRRRANNKTRAHQVASVMYQPGMCWCDDACAAAGDCCATSSQCQKRAKARRTTAGISDVDTAQSPVPIGDNSPVATAVAAEAAALAATKQHKDCGAVHPYPVKTATAGVNGSAVNIAAVPDSQLHAEMQMQACQAADEGPPATPVTIPLHWTAGSVCQNGQCTGGAYSTDLVKQQINYINSMYAHVGVQFSWDGIIHKAIAAKTMDIDVCTDSTGDNCWICKQRRYGNEVAINVMTSPTHVGGYALGVTLFPSYFVTGAAPACANWVYIYEKTLPGQNGRSLVDNGLADSGSTLAHEIGHQLMLHHTWYEEGSQGLGPLPPVAKQCKDSASMAPYDIIQSRSDGVRDTPAQSLNGTDNPVTSILRFTNCDPRTGAYTNTTAYAQQSCTSRDGFPDGDLYFNNYNNLMSYGDKTCLRILTAGQGARARCAIKCMRQRAC